MEAVTPLVFWRLSVFSKWTIAWQVMAKKKNKNTKKRCGCFYRIHEYFNLAFNRGEGALCTSKHRCCLPRRHPNPSFWNAFAALYRLLEVKMRLKRCHYVNQQSAYSLLWKPTSPVIYHLCSLGLSYSPELWSSSKITISPVTKQTKAPLSGHGAVFVWQMSSHGCKDRVQTMQCWKQACKLT